MKVSRITKTKEGQNVQIQDQSDAHHFFYQKGLVHHEFVPEGQTVNQHFYKEVLEHLHDGAMQQAQFVGESFMADPSQQCTCTHCSSVRQFLASKQVTCLKHLLYSPDLAPSNS